MNSRSKLWSATRGSALAAVLLLLTTCRDTTPDVDIWLRLPAGTDVLMPVPPDNPLTRAKVELGKRLFFDTRLSGDGSVSCATCHRPELAFTDGKELAIGIGNRAGRRNVPSLLHGAYRVPLFWDGRARTLEEQALMPIENPDEMGHSIDASLTTLQADRSYRSAFDSAFGGPGITRQRLAKALAAYERTILPPPAPFDRAVIDDDPPAMSAAARRGMALFEGRARCAFCHKGNAFADGLFHNTGVGWSETRSDRGRYEVTGDERDDGKFRTASLRGLTHTAPYMHDGSVATLLEVVEFYDRGANANPRLDPILRPLGLSRSEQRDLVAFLEALSAPGPYWDPSRPQ